MTSEINDQVTENEPSFEDIFCHFVIDRTHQGLGKRLCGELPSCRCNHCGRYLCGRHSARPTLPCMQCVHAVSTPHTIAPFPLFGQEANIDVHHGHELAPEAESDEVPIARMLFFVRLVPENNKDSRTPVQKKKERKKERKNERTKERTTERKTERMKERKKEIKK